MMRSFARGNSLASGLPLCAWAMVLVACGAKRSEGNRQTSPTALHGDVQDADGVWLNKALTHVDHMVHTTVRLDDGRVLVVGGLVYDTVLGADSTSACEIYDPEKNVWELAAPLPRKTAAGMLVRLKSGLFLYAGADILRPANTSFLFDPAAVTEMPDGSRLPGRWIQTGSLPVSLWATANTTGVLLGDGRVLIAGGISDDSNFAGDFSNLSGSRYSFVYTPTRDPPRGHWDFTRDSSGRVTRLHEGRFATPLVPLPDGKVLVMGGQNFGFTDRETARASVESFDPETGRWTRAPDMPATEEDLVGPSSTPGARVGAVERVLPDGRVLVAGGYFDTDQPSSNVVDRRSTLIFDPIRQRWSRTGDMHTVRRMALSVNLPEGEGTLVAAGAGTPEYLGPGCTDPGGIEVDLYTSEIFHPESGSWSQGAELPHIVISNELADAYQYPHGLCLLASSTYNIQTSQVELGNGRLFIEGGFSNETLTFNSFHSYLFVPE